MKYLVTRLIKEGAYLRRQNRGTRWRRLGETQLETNRRLLANKVKALGIHLKKLKRQREILRRSGNCNLILFQ